jgi:hypothetical protein
MENMHSSKLSAQLLRATLASKAAELALKDERIALLVAEGKASTKAAAVQEQAFRKEMQLLKSKCREVLDARKKKCQAMLMKTESKLEASRQELSQQRAEFTKRSTLLTDEIASMEADFEARLKQAEDAAVKAQLAHLDVIASAPASPSSSLAGDYQSQPLLLGAAFRKAPITASWTPEELCVLTRTTGAAGGEPSSTRSTLPVSPSVGASSTAPALPIRQGVLMKRKKWMGGWAERLFVLTSTHLAYAYPCKQGADASFGNTNSNGVGEWGHPAQRYTLRGCEVSLLTVEGMACVQVRVHEESGGAAEDFVLRPHARLGQMPAVTDDSQESMTDDARAAVRMATAYGSKWTLEKECHAWHAAIQKATRALAAPSTGSGSVTLDIPGSSRKDQQAQLVMFKRKKRNPNRKSKSPSSSRGLDDAQPS